MPKRNAAFPIRISLLLCFCCCFAASCSAGGAAGAEEGFAEDSYYFSGLKSVHAGDTEAATAFFRKGSEVSSVFFQKLCFEQLTHYGTKEDRYAAAERYIAMEKDEGPFRAAEVYYEYGDYKKIISLTDKKNITLTDDLKRLRLMSLVLTGSKQFYDEAADWFTKKNLSGSHIQFYREFTNFLSAEGTSVSSLKNSRSAAPLVQLMEMRISLYNRDYARALALLRKYVPSSGSGAERLAEFEPALLSDAGKIFLYGSTDHVKNALLFDKAAALPGSQEQSFMRNFYAGRLYDRSGSKNAWIAADRFLQAMQHAPSDMLYDNALWYYLSTLLKVSVNDAVEGVAEYGTKIHDGAYFSDFYDSLALAIFADRDWDSFYKVYKKMIESPAAADPEIRSKYAYIAGRLIEENLYTSAEDSSAEMAACFRNACIPGGNLYYALLAAGPLGLSERETISILLNVETSRVIPENNDAERLLQGLISFGLYEKAYPAWLKYRDDISLDAAVALSRDLRGAQGQYSKALSDALRIASYAAGHAEKNLNLAVLKELFPRNYSEYVVPISEKYGLPAYYMYALIRSESFFDPSVVSYAGARGLTQLMESTAGDIAGKLKVKEYSLFDPETNILFGTFYLAEMIRRLDGSPVLGLCAYNAGITRVRRWIRDGEGLPRDLVIETIPFSETRGYAQKTVAAAAIYAVLYDNISIAETVRSMLG